MTYSFSIPAARVRPHQSLALHLMLAIVLFATGVLCIGLYWFTSVSPRFATRIATFGILGGICFIAALVVGILAMRSRRKNQPALRLVEGVVLTLGAVVFIRNGWVAPAALFGVLGVLVFLIHGLETAAGTRRSTLVIDDAGVHRPFSLRTRHLAWHELKAVLLRRGILTIDCLDNRLYQYQVPQAGTANDAASFEAWCAERIRESAPKRSKSDW